MTGQFSLILTENSDHLGHIILKIIMKYSPPFLYKLFEPIVFYINIQLIISAQNQILDSRQQRRHYQIIFDLNTNDLNKRQDLELSGRLKVSLTVKAERERERERERV